MRIAAAVKATPACRAGDEAKLNEEGLDHVLDRVARFAEASRECLNADRSAAVEVGDHRQVAPVHRVEAKRVDLEPVERAVGYGRVDRVGTGRMGEIAHPPQEASRDARSAARAARDLA